MNCYVVDPSEYYQLPKDLNKDNTWFFPEEGMSTRQRISSSKPRDFHIVTDCPEFVSLYYPEEVFVWKNGEWENQHEQGFNTFGTSVNLIRSKIFDIQYTLPYAIVDDELVTNCMGRKTKLNEK